MPPCRFFAQGRCTYGTSCRNSHEATIASASSLSTPSPTLISSPHSKPISLEKPSASSKEVCWFFLQGKCTYGASCKNSHESTNATDEPHLGQTPRASMRSTQSTTSTKIRIPIRPRSADEDRNPGEVSISETQLPESWREKTVPGPPKEGRQAVPCRFFGEGYCRNGESCPFSHSLERANIESVTKHITDILTPQNDVSALSTLKLSSREIHGALVKFSAGGEVSDIKLGSDFSSIEITGLPIDTKADFVGDFLAEVGFPVPESSIITKSIGESGSIAEVRIEDPNFAQSVVQEYSARQYMRANTGVSIKQKVGDAATGFVGNRLQISTVTCMWYDASCPAYLSYGTRKRAVDARKRLETKKICGRTPNCFIQEPGGDFRTTLQVNNLHPITRRNDITVLLPQWLQPLKITFGDASQGYVGDGSGSVVEGLLGSIGELDIPFQYSSSQGSSKMKGIATFVDREKAALAVRTFHDTHIKELGGSKLLLSLVVSIKYKVPTAIFEALKLELDELRKSIWQDGHVQLKTYLQTDPTKPFTTLHIFGSTIRSAKADLERLIAGKMVMDGKIPLWNPYFFTSEALAYLNDLGRTHKMYIFRDNRKYRLLTYGGSETSHLKIQQVLIDKVESLRKLVHTITLTKNLLEKAMQGGMGRLKAKFGGKMKLNISQNPKTISIIGSIADFHEAQALLIDSSQFPDVFKPGSQEEDCIACWTEAVDPVYTSCGHVYCRDCFTNQASSADDGDIPIHCFGAEGTCTHIFSMQELTAMLSFASLDDLLQTSFASYIRSRPKEFQYCPTPDCPRIYRLTNSGETFFCSTCLATVCTTCNVLSHDGMTCEEYRDLNSDGTKALKKWAKENDARSCPACKMLIQKTFGCNHMACKQCNTHICWFCMKNFDTSEACYTHMERMHGSNGA